MAGNQAGVYLYQLISMSPAADKMKGLVRHVQSVCMLGES